MLVLDGLDDAGRLRLAIQGEKGVYRGHHEVQASEHVVGEIERAVLEDINLTAGEHAHAILLRSVELSDIFELLREADFVEAAGLEARFRVVGDAEVFPAVGFGRSGHLVERVVAIRFRRVIVEDAAEVGELDEFRQLTRFGSVDLAIALAEFGRNPRQAKRAENLCLALSARRDRLLVDRLEAPLTHAEAAPERAVAHSDIMLLGAREVMERKIELFRRDDTKIGLQAVLEAHAGLRLTVGGDFLDARIGDEPVHDRLRLRRGHEEVQIADRLAGTAERASGFGERDLGQGAQAGENRLGDGGGFVPAVAFAVGDAVLDAFEDLILRLGAEALELGDRAGFTDLLQLHEVFDREQRPERADLLRAEARNLHNLEEAGGNGSLELLVERQDAVASERRDLVDERFAEAGDIGELACVDEFAQILGHVLEDTGAGGISADLERVLPGQFHERGDFVEDAGDVILLHHGRRAFSAR